MDVYRQEPEIHLLRSLISRLDDKRVIDVGAERGAFVEALLEAGSSEIHAIEPEPDNAAFLRAYFRDDLRVRVHEYALHSTDGQLDMHKSADPSGAPLTYGHTLLERRDTAEIVWPETVSVTGRSLGSLVDAGEIPKRVGILKVDTEGNDFAVVDGMGDLGCDVIMVEHWTDLPHSLGSCPWTIEDMTDRLGRRGFSQFVHVEHRGEFVLMKWNDADIAPGNAGNLVFVQDQLVDVLAPALLETALLVSEQNVALGEMYAAEAGARLDVIRHLEQGIWGRRRDILVDALLRRIGRDHRE